MCQSVFPSNLETSDLAPVLNFLQRFFISFLFTIFYFFIFYFFCSCTVHLGSLSTALTCNRLLSQVPRSVWPFITLNIDDESVNSAYAIRITRKLVAPSQICHVIGASSESGKDLELLFELSRLTCCIGSNCETNISLSSISFSPFVMSRLYLLPGAVTVHQSCR